MTIHPIRRNRIAIALWLIFALACGVIISRSQFTADLSAFLPRSPTPAQRLLLEQLQNGVASRLIVVGIEGADATTRANLSRQIAQRLRADPAFVSVNNGESVNFARDRAFLFDHRYLLSPAVTPARFTVAGLHAALADSVDLLASSAGLLVKSLLTRDPTGEMLQLLDQFNSNAPAPLRDGVWASRDGTRALLLLQTRAAGGDIDGQQQAMTNIRRAFATIPGAHATARLLMTGPGVFAVLSRDTIKNQVTRLSLLSIALIATLLLLVYRSFTALALGFLPVISGALAGVAAVSIGFGSVHGITLGFGTALIGEAVDYSIYLFVQSARGGAAQQHWITRFWPTIRLGVLTSICGFAALLWSGFPGLAQLGLYAIAGLVAAAAVTRHVLPHLLPTSFRIHETAALQGMLPWLVQRATALRWPAALVLLSAAVVLSAHHGDLWNDQIASLSPVSQADVKLDATLRAETGAPDVRYVVLVSAANQEAALRSAEQVSTLLQTRVERGELAGFETPSRYLPSIATQTARRNSLPPPDELAGRLAQAVVGLPVRAQAFTAFLDDVANARRQPLLQTTDLRHTSMALAVAALLLHESDGWRAVLPLTAPAHKAIDANALHAALSAAHLPNVMLVDLKVESDHLYAGYLHEAILLSLGGVLAIIALLLWVFRSLRRVLRIIAPLAAAVITVTAGLALFDQQLILLHLVGLLLIVAIGSNYALFFAQADRSSNESAAGDRNGIAPARTRRRFEKPDEGRTSIDGQIAPRTLASLLFANLTTVAGFGVLAFSKISILQALGVTVAPGVMLALIYAAVFARGTDV